MREVTRLFEVLLLIRQQVSKDMPIQQVLLLLAVAREPGVTMPELMRILDMPQGTVSRNVKALGYTFSRQSGTVVTRGYGLVRTMSSADNSPVRAVYLTKRGAALIEELARQFGADCSVGAGTAKMAQRRLTDNILPLAH